MNTNKRQILIIEDNEINHDILTSILEDDYNILIAENGKVGMQMLRQHSSEINVVLLDIQMPVMNGYEVLQEARKDPLLKEIPIIITTGADSKGDEIKCLQLGATDFVRKPYDPLLVRLRVDNIIRLRESTEANRQKTQFFHNMTHEIRTPMNAIMGFTQLLAMPDNMLDEGDRAMYSRYVINNSLILIRMIDDLLAISDVDNGSFTINKKDTNIKEVCESAMTAVKYNATEGVNMYFTTDLPDDYTAYTDGSRAQTVLVHFLMNACKFTEAGEIHLHCSESETPGTILLSVTDTGRGVPAEEAERIFDRFIKLDAYVPGNGLGLSIARKIAEYLDGKAYLDTSYTGGARFVFELPK